MCFIDFKDLMTIIRRKLENGEITEEQAMEEIAEVQAKFPEHSKIHEWLKEREFVNGDRRVSED